MNATTSHDVKWGRELLQHKGRYVVVICYTNLQGSRLYSGETGLESLHESQSAAKCVCSSPKASTNKNCSETTEVPMGEKLNSTVVRYGHSSKEWLNHHSFKIVLVLSLLHIGLAYVHTQHSSTADCLFLFRCNKA